MEFRLQPGFGWRSEILQITKNPAQAGTPCLYLCSTVLNVWCSDGRMTLSQRAFSLPTKMLPLPSPGYIFV